MGRVGHHGGFTLESGRCGTEDIFIGTFQDGIMTCWPYNRMGGQAVETGMGEFIPTGNPEGEKYPPLDTIAIHAAPNAHLNQKHDPIPALNFSPATRTNRASRSTQPSPRNAWGTTSRGSSTRMRSTHHLPWRAKLRAAVRARPRLCRACLAILARPSTRGRDKPICASRRFSAP